jgi:multiple sugar transport system permease protein
MQASSVVPRRIQTMSPAEKWLRWLLGRGILYVIVVLLAIVFGFPFFWTLSSSLKTAPELFRYPPTVFPKVPQFINYAKIFSAFRLPIPRWFLNSIFLVTINMVGTILSCTLVAYGFARFRARGREVLFMITLGTMMLPSQVTLIPQFILFHRLGWVDTFRPLWVPSFFGGGAFNIFLMRQFLLTIPMEFDEAAKIDGAGYWRILFTVLLPLCKPVLATLAIITFMAHWNNFLGPLIYLNSPAKFTVAVGLRFFNQDPEAIIGEPMQHVLMAFTVLSIAPCLIVFFAGQSYFVRGVVMSGIKG